MKGLFLSVFTITLLSFCIISCDKVTPEASVDTFDRKEMLTFWANEIIIPAYQDYATKTTDLNEKINDFTSNPTSSSLKSLRESWLNAYIVWQKVAMFEIGKAEELSLIAYTNIYPTNIEFINKKIKEGYDLTKSSTQDIQGFPAVEYLIYGIKSTDVEIIDYYKSADNAKYTQFLKDISNKITQNAKAVNEDWKTYKAKFIENSGSSATASVNKLINDYLFYFEKHLRAGKVGIPAGVFSSVPNGDEAEAPYAGKSKTLLLTGLDAVESFFNGKSYGGKKDGKSLKAYINEIKPDSKLSEKINANFKNARTEINKLEESFKEQVTKDKNKLNIAYDALQKNVTLMKADMFSALSIDVDYVDADGD